MPVDKSERVASEHATRFYTLPDKNGATGFYQDFLSLVNKTALRSAILLQLRQELVTQTNAAVMARDEAISEESRAESKWDTHSQEAAYLAEGQARLAGEIGASIELYSTLPFPDFSATDSIAVGAIVELEPASGAARKRSAYFLGPRAGGIEVTVDGTTLLVLTPQSPLGRQLLGKHVGDTVQGPGRGPTARQRIVAVG